MLELRIGPEGLRVNCGSSLEVRGVRVLDSRPGIGAELRRLTFGGAAGIDILRQLWASQVFLQISQDENTQNVEELYAVVVVVFCISIPLQSQKQRTTSGPNKGVRVQ